MILKQPVRIIPTCTIFTTSGQYDIFYGAVWGTRTAFKIGIFVIGIAVIIGVVVTHAAPAAQLTRCLDALVADDTLDRVIVVDNGAYGTIRMHQERDHPLRVSGTELKTHDFVRMAEGYGCYAERVTATADFGPALERARATASASFRAACSCACTMRARSASSADLRSVAPSTTRGATAASNMKRMSFR